MQSPPPPQSTELFLRIYLHRLDRAQVHCSLRLLLSLRSSFYGSTCTGWTELKFIAVSASSSVYGALSTDLLAQVGRAQVLLQSPPPPQSTELNSTDLLAQVGPSSSHCSLRLLLSLRSSFYGSTCTGWTELKFIAVSASSSVYGALSTDLLAQVGPSSSSLQSPPPPQSTELFLRIYLHRLDRAQVHCSLRLLLSLRSSFYGSTCTGWTELKSFAVSASSLVYGAQFYGSTCTGWTELKSFAVSASSSVYGAQFYGSTCTGWTELKSFAVSASSSVYGAQFYGSTCTGWTELKSFCSLRLLLGLQSSILRIYLHRLDRAQVLCSLRLLLGLRSSILRIYLHRLQLSGNSLQSPPPPQSTDLLATDLGWTELKSFAVSASSSVYGAQFYWIYLHRLDRAQVLCSLRLLLGLQSSILRIYLHRLDRAQVLLQSPPPPQSTELNSTDLLAQVGPSSSPLQSPPPPWSTELNSMDLLAQVGPSSSPLQSPPPPWSTELNSKDLLAHVGPSSSPLQSPPPPQSTELNSTDLLAQVGPSSSPLQSPPPPWSTELNSTDLLAQVGPSSSPLQSPPPPQSTELNSTDLLAQVGPSSSPLQYPPPPQSTELNSTDLLAQVGPSSSPLQSPPPPQSTELNSTDLLAQVGPSSSPLQSPPPPWSTELNSTDLLAQVGPSSSPFAVSASSSVYGAQFYGSTCTGWTELKSFAVSASSLVYGAQFYGSTCTGWTELKSFAVSASSLVYGAQFYGSTCTGNYLEATWESLGPSRPCPPRRPASPPPRDPPTWTPSQSITGLSLCHSRNSSPRSPVGAAVFSSSSSADLELSDGIIVIKDFINIKRVGQHLQPDRRLSV